MTKKLKGQKPKTPAISKYRAKKITADGITFDSKKEAKRYKELKELQSRGEIHDLQLQVSYELLPTQREPDTVGKRGGVHKGKVIERPVYYIADFVYKSNSGETIVEDVKGMSKRLPEYVIKRKLMLYVHGIHIKET